MEPSQHSGHSHNSQIGWSKSQNIVVISQGMSSRGGRHRRMVDTLKFPLFHGFGNEDLKQHLFICETLWDANNFQYENAKIVE